jgi:regulator of sirC expression with transglutaminase-like and TPR domain
VLRQYEFEDVARIYIHYGWERVARQAAGILLEDPTASIVERQLGNIKTAMLELPVLKRCW